MSALPPLDDTAAMSVFADLLQVRGDPRGELVQLQLARERFPSDARLARAEAQHLARNDRHLLGALRTATSLCQLSWRRGFIVEARLQSWTAGQPQWFRGRWVEPSPPARPKLPRLVRELLSLESARPLQMLTVALPRSRFSGEQLVRCAEVVARAKHGELRVLALHLLDPVPRDWSDEWEVGPTTEFSMRGLHVSAASPLAVELSRALE
ncbi:MAG: hypothetical protein ACOZQL_11365 [Myxococcota bacterium]